MTENRKVLIFYDWFYPGYKAGGPIQSITNLTVTLVSGLQVFVVTSGYDHHSDIAYENVAVDEWNEVTLPGSNAVINVYYASKAALNTAEIQKLIQYISPDTIYLNGIFSYRFFLMPLMVLKSIKSDCKVVICPRGMLKKGALTSKSFKKKIYLQYLKVSKLVKNANWHATSEEEAKDIQTHFSQNKGILIAPNIPKMPLNSITPLQKKNGELKLVYLSLINPHKNLLLLLQFIAQSGDGISLDVFGPVTDKDYWNLCEALIKQMPGKVQYKDDVQPANVQQVLSQYHLLILLTKGENFGHALYESMSVGRPVITTQFTPWQNLYEKKAGANVDIANAAECLENINQFANMNQEEYNTFCAGAHALAVNYFKNLNAEEKYRQLF